MRRTLASGAILAIAANLGCIGCKSIDKFDTGQNGAYCGEMIGGLASDGLIPDVPDGNKTRLKLALTLDMQHLGDYPGRLTSNDSADGLCAGQRLFDKALVRTVQPTLRDPIASVQITPDHEHDVFTWVDSACQGTFLSIISLMYDGRVEVRLFKPMREEDAGAPANLRSGFGVFSLARNDSGCGF